MPDFTLLRLPMLLACFRRERPEAIFCYGGAETVLALALKRLTGVKVVRFRGQETKSFGSFNQLRQRWSHEGVDFVLSPSEFIAGELRQLGITNPIATVPLGCDQQRYCHVPKVSKDDRARMLVFGRFDPVKGHVLMIERTAEILRMWGDQPCRPQLHIVGEPANVSVADLVRAVQRAGLVIDDDVTITTGRVEDVAALMSEAALGVVPSIGSEIICRVAEEFLLCGTPVAVSAAGSLPEVVFPGAGFCFGAKSETDTVQSFIEWIRTSLGESEVDKLARTAAAVQRFSLPAMAAGLQLAIDQYLSRS
jgi:glycosyltransferase involved in cell wall biosynthesis